MAHPHKNDAAKMASDKLHKMTSEYGAANPAMNKNARVTRMKQEGPEDVPGFGTDADAPTGRRGDRAPRARMANAQATLKHGGHAKARKHGGHVKHRDGGGDVSSIEEANRDQSMASKADGRAHGGRSPKGKGGKGKGTHVNVMVMPGAGGAGPGAAPGGPPMMPPHPMMPPGGPPMPPRPPMAGGPPGMPPGLPPGAGAGPPGMPPGGPMVPPPGGIPPGLIPPHRRGGRVGRASGGRADGGPTGSGQQQQAGSNQAGFDAMQRQYNTPITGRARGGKVHADEAQDKALIKKTLHDEGLTPSEPGTKARAHGGVTGYDAGALSGEGRLQKIKNYGRKTAHEKPQVV